jgi:hypothetical protein
VALSQAGVGAPGDGRVREVNNPEVGSVGKLTGDAQRTAVCAVA